MYVQLLIAPNIKKRHNKNMTNTNNNNFKDINVKFPVI